jgi:hypothetical protein
VTSSPPPGDEKASLIVEREYQQGQLYSAGRALGDNELRLLTIGGSILPGPANSIKSQFFEVEIAGYGDYAWLQIFDHSPLQKFYDEQALPNVEVVITPTRTSIGVVLSRCVALGVAIAGSGRVVEDDLSMFPSDFDEFETFIAEHSLKGTSENFAVRCEQFLRQFPQLHGWPSEG